MPHPGVEIFGAIVGAQVTFEVPNEVGWLVEDLIAGTAWDLLGNRMRLRGV
jgi:hypothetical protein